jgi:hypothetical protein
MNTEHLDQPSIDSSQNDDSKSEIFVSTFEVMPTDERHSIASPWKMGSPVRGILRHSEQGKRIARPRDWTTIKTVVFRTQLVDIKLVSKYSMASLSCDNLAAPMAAPTYNDNKTPTPHPRNISLPRAQPISHIPSSYSLSDLDGFQPNKIVSVDDSRKSNNLITHLDADEKATETSLLPVQNKSKSTMLSMIIQNSPSFQDDNSFLDASENRMNITSTLVIPQSCITSMHEEVFHEILPSDNCADSNSLIHNLEVKTNSSQQQTNFPNPPSIILENQSALGGHTTSSTLNRTQSSNESHSIVFAGTQGKKIAVWTQLFKSVFSARPKENNSYNKNSMLRNGKYANYELPRSLPISSFQ